ncbi:Hsp20/alpha crystallin family protein [Croceitalea rosinachiae]|uniref:Hsp20/alpha crystallin family protein n=1 Tax=Croceitalea rosinachiae TaxID=3075596 RepID=A0ABU3AE27_9FLAO|nr:Hsp20/alpha crystallin family protein [Croceitalea sp. F388]MDT0608249.1 Hsp20/alpha crystallin family protein [Croceitalea sp. F388]
MSLVKRNNLIFPSLMNDIFNPDWFGGMENRNGNLPAVNIIENDNDFVLELSAPGFKKDNFNIELDNDVLTISSEVKTESEAKQEKFTRREFSYTSFKRAFTLPETVDGGKINATYENGILKVVVPKKEEALPKPKRLIDIT